MKKKILFVMMILLTFFTLETNVLADETISVKTLEEYYNAFESPDIRIGLTKDYLYTQFRLFFYPIEILEAIADNISRYVALSDIPDYEENDPIKNL